MYMSQEVYCTCTWLEMCLLMNRVMKQRWATISGCHKHYSAAGQSSVTSDAAIWRGCAVGDSFPPPNNDNNNHFWYNDQSNFKPSVSHTQPPCACCAHAKLRSHVQTNTPWDTQWQKKGRERMSQITQDPSWKKTLSPDSHVSSVSAFCQTKSS